MAALAGGIFWLAASPATAADPECTALGGVFDIPSGECQISASPNNRSNAAHGGPFNLAETLRIKSTGKITVSPPASGASLTLNIAGQLIMEAGSKISGDVTTTGGVGATITVNASGNILLAGSTISLPGAAITATQIAGSCTTGGHGGLITLNSTGGDVTTEVGSLVSVNATCVAGDIFITALAGKADIDGSVLAQSTLSGTGGGQAGGGTITIKSCDLEVSDTGLISSRGQDPGADLVHLEACFVVIHGKVESISTNAGHEKVSNLCNSDPANHPLGGAVEFAGCVEVWSGTTIVIDQSGGNNGEVSADGVRSPNRAWIDLFANGDITITGGAGYAVHANGATGGPTSNSFGGLITVKSKLGKVTADGNAIQANAVGVGSDGGDVIVQAGGAGAAGDVAFGTASVQAEGPNGDNTKGGHISAKSFNGSVTGSAGGELNAAGGLLQVTPVPGTVTLEACVADPAVTYDGTVTGTETDNGPGFCTGTPDIPATLPSNCSSVTCFSERPPDCEKATVKSVLNPFTGRFPGNAGPDKVIKVQNGDLIQPFIDGASDTNGDGYIILLVVAKNGGVLGGSTVQNVDISLNYPNTFALFGCSVTLIDPDKADALPAGLIEASANSPNHVAPFAPGNIFVMDLHGSGSEVAGWKVEGNGRYMRNVATNNGSIGMWFLGNSNTMHNGNGNDNAGSGILVQGNGNTVDSSDAFGNGGNGVTVIGGSNKILKVDAGDRGKGNTWAGILVSGNSNLLQENDVYASGLNGIGVTGNSNTLLKNQAGDRNKGNWLDGITVSGASNVLQENEAYANGHNGMTAVGGVNTLTKNTAGDRGDKANTAIGFFLSGGGSLTQNTAIGNLSDGFRLTTSGFSLLKNVSGGSSSGQPNGGCQYNFLVAGDTNAGSNKSNNVVMVGSPFPAGCK